MLELERIEAQAWEDMASAAPAPLAKAIGLETARLGRAHFLMAARVPEFQVNRLSGAGLDGDDGSSIAAAVARFKAAGQPKFFVQIPPGPDARRMEALARGAGLEPHPLAWAKFHRTVETPPRVDSSLTIREVGREERMFFGDTAAAGFGMPAPMAQWLYEIVGRPHWHTYVSFDGDEAAGVGALYVDGAFAWLGVGATRAEMRKRGGQSALLARRIADAQKLGARHATTETGVPQPGAEAPSYKNILKVGFAVAYVRPNWTATS
jgi:hypothetical protein